MSDKKLSNQLESSLEDVFKKLPPLPANATETLFKITPWIALIFGVLGVLLSISALSALSFLAPIAAVGGVAQNIGLGMIATVGWLISSAIMIMAYPGLKAGKMSGWTLLFWAEVVSAATSIIGINIGSVIGAAIGFYLIFQIKSKYK